MKKFFRNVIEYIAFPILLFVVAGCATVRGELAEVRAAYTARIDAQCSGDISAERETACALLRQRIESLQNANDASIEEIERELFEALLDAPR